MQEPFMNTTEAFAAHREPWNKGKLVGQKAPLRLRDIWAIRIRIQLAGNVCALALFNLAINSKLRACDLVKLRVRDIAHGEHIDHSPTKDTTHGAVRNHGAHSDIGCRMDQAGCVALGLLFVSDSQHDSPHLSTRQYARIVDGWIAAIGLDLDVIAYGTHTMRRTKASLIYRRTKNLRAVQLLLGHSKLESTVRYLRIEVDDAFETAEQTDVSFAHAE
jgi:integrase